MHFFLHFLHRSQALGGVGTAGTCLGGFRLANFTILGRGKGGGVENVVAMSEDQVDCKREGTSRRVCEFGKVRVQWIR